MRFIYINQIDVFHNKNINLFIIGIIVKYVT